MKSASQLSYPAPQVPSRALHWILFTFSALCTMLPLFFLWEYGWNRVGWHMLAALVPSILPLGIGILLRAQWRRKSRALAQHEKLRNELLMRHHTEA